MTIKFDLGHDLERWGVRIYRIVTGVTSDVGVPSNRLVIVISVLLIICHHTIIVIFVIITVITLPILPWCLSLMSDATGKNRMVTSRHDISGNSTVCSTVQTNNKENIWLVLMEESTVLPMKTLNGWFPSPEKQCRLAQRCHNVGTVVPTLGQR